MAIIILIIGFGIGQACAWVVYDGCEVCDSDKRDEERDIDRFKMGNDN